MKLEHNNGIAAIAADERKHEKKQAGKKAFHPLGIAPQDAQTGHPTRPQGESSAEACCHMHVEGLDRLRTQLEARFSILRYL